jgi:histidinol dehydrogenase
MALAVRRLDELDRNELDRILARSTAAIFAPELTSSVGQIIEDVRLRGDAAVCDALARFDGVECSPADLLVDEAEIAGAAPRIGGDVLAAIRTGIQNIRAFNERVLVGAEWLEEIAPGLLVGEQSRPIASAGLFVPSGKGSFPSVLMHIGTPAIVAGVVEIVVVVPPSAGRGLEVDPAVLVVADELGLRKVYRANGPAGIAAVAFGTETIPRVDKVVGPGSPAVTSAQLQVQAYGCATEMLFGPSESLLLADDSADPVVLAADVLNEAEHGDDSVALLVTASDALVGEVARELDRQLEGLPEPRRSYAARRSAPGSRPRRGVRVCKRIRPRAPASRRAGSGGAAAEARPRGGDPAGRHAVRRGELPHRRAEHAPDGPLRPCELGGHGAHIPEDELPSPNVTCSPGRALAWHRGARPARGLPGARGRDRGHPGGRSGRSLVMRAGLRRATCRPA